MVGTANKHSLTAAANARRRQALAVWAGAIAVTGLWTLAIVATPAAKAAGVEGFSAPLYTFFGYICHQMPDRSLHILGEQFGVCTRCFGVYFGLLAGVAVYPLWRGVDNIQPLARFWLFLSLIPISVDWSLTALGIWENTQLTRLTTGIILGLACAAFIYPALVEITRSASYRAVRTADGP